MSGTGKNPRVIAIVGPQSSGKTSLLESILCQTSALERRSGNGIRLFGDTSHEAKARTMGTEINVASTQFMGDTYTFLDCPGSLELTQETYGALLCVDAAVVVTETESDKIIGLSPLLKLLEDRQIPRFIFVNKVDKASQSIRQLATTLQSVSQTPIVLRHIPIRKDNEITGFIDLASERAYVYNKHKPSKSVDLPSAIESDVEDARYAMLETLADYDEKLMEELLEDIHPPQEEVFQDLAQDLQEGLIIPVMMGSALNENGVHRLLKALRHEIPDIDSLHDRLHLSINGEPLAQIVKTYHIPHMGKISLARVLRGEIREGDTLNGDRPSGLFRLAGEKTDKIKFGHVGEMVGLSRLETAKTGDILVIGTGKAPSLPGLNILPPVFVTALTAQNRNDEVKLITSLAKISEEDPSITYEQVAEVHQIHLKGQGEVHLQIAKDRLQNKYGISVNNQTPKIPYKETIRKGTKHHSRYKKQSGGHGQFGDVVIEIEPRPLGTGFAFKQSITGGAIPRQYIPSVESGVKEYLQTGPLGFPVVDVGVNLVDGSYHAVDSSDMAFKTAGRMAMSEALPNCDPVLLEPIMHVNVMVPAEFAGQINSLISSRRGKILGFDAREDWPGWETIEAHMPQSEMHDMIVELRSTTLGAGTYVYAFDHLSELTGRLATQILQQQGQAAE